MNTRIPAASEYENFSLDATGILVTAHQPQTRPSCSLPRSPTRIAGKGNTPACHQPAPKTTEMTDGQTHDDDRMLRPNLQYPTKLQAKAASWNPPPVQRRIGFFPHLANSPTTPTKNGRRLPFQKAACRFNCRIILFQDDSCLRFPLYSVQPEPSKQWVQSLHFGSPMALTKFSSLLNCKEVSPNRCRIISTIRLYSGEPVVE